MLKTGEEATVDEGFGGTLLGEEVIVDRPAAHGLRQGGAGVKVIEDKEALCYLSGGGWEAAREVGGNEFHDGLTVSVQVLGASVQRVADGGLRFGFGLVRLRSRRSGRLIQI